MLHSRCFVEALARDAILAPLRCAEVGHGTRCTRRDTLEDVDQADPGLRNRIAWMEEGVRGDADLRSLGLWYGWDYSTLGVGPPLDASLNDLQQCFAAGKKLQSQLAGAHAYLRVRVLAKSATLWDSTGRTGLGDAKLSPLGDCAVVHPAGLAALIRRPDQEAGR